MVNYMGALDRVATKSHVMVRIVAHARAGDLRPTFWSDPEDGAGGVERLDAALDESTRAVLDRDGTIAGGHGVGNAKRKCLAGSNPPKRRNRSARSRPFSIPKTSWIPARRSCDAKPSVPIRRWGEKSVNFLFVGTTPGYGAAW